MDVNEFRENIIEDSRFNFAANGTSTKQEFLSLFMNYLIEAEEFEEINPIFYESAGSHNRQLQVDAWAKDSLEDCLQIIICQFTDKDQPDQLVKTEAERIFGRAKAFIEDSVSGFLAERGEQSSPGYMFARDIQTNLESISKFKFYILTDMIMSSRIQEVSDTLIAGRPASYSIWDMNRLFSLYSSKTEKETIAIDLTQFLPEGLACLKASSTDDYTAYLCNMPGIILAKLYNNYGGRLLEGNVRSYLSSRGKVNKGIRNTILKEPAKFFAYNNGIACTASNPQFEDKGGVSYLKSVENLQIVNGGQTTASLAMALINDKDRANNLDNIFVPMKLSIIAPEKAIDLIPSISHYANSQNKVSDADLSSNHPFHVRMQDFSRRLTAPAINGNQYGTYWYYERAKGQYDQEQAKLNRTERKKFQMQIPPNQKITKTDLAKYINAYRCLPHIVCLGAQKNYIKFAEWALNDDNGAWATNDAQFNEVYFKKIVGLAILFKQTDMLIKDQDWYQLGYKAQVTAYTISKLFFEIKSQYLDRQLDILEIWNKQSIPTILQTQIVSIAKSMYQHLTIENRGLENVTEWAKRSECWEKAQQIKIPLAADIENCLIETSEAITTEKQAKKEQKANNRASAMVEVANFGAGNWGKLLDWGVSQKVLTPSEISLVKEAANMSTRSFPTESKCQKILQILQRAREESFPG